MGSDIWPVEVSVESAEHVRLPRHCRRDDRMSSGSDEIRSTCGSDPTKPSNSRAGPVADFVARIRTFVYSTTLMAQTSAERASSPRRLLHRSPHRRVAANWRQTCRARAPDYHVQPFDRLPRERDAALRARWLCPRRREGVGQKAAAASHARAPRGPAHVARRRDHRLNQAMKVKGSCF